MSDDHHKEQDGDNGDEIEVGFEEHVLTTLKHHAKILQGLHKTLDKIIENNEGMLEIIDKLADRVDALEQNM